VPFFIRFPFFIMVSLNTTAACPRKPGPPHKIVTCPWHGSQWDVTNGNLVWFQRPLPNEPVYKVLVEGDEVFVEI
jgi:nitrite reductase/ring-hydroxylating ferredoxin subunit